MKYNKALLLIVCVGILTGLLLYFYPQKTDEKKDFSAQNQYSGQILQKNAVVSLPQTDSPDNASINATQITGNKSRSTPAKSNQTGDKESSPVSKEDIITKYFLQDLIEYILEQFYPPQSKNNQNDIAKSNLSFKEVNARYGLQLTGLRYESESLDRARREILNKVLQPQRLNRIFSRYVDEFINKLEKKAEAKEYEFVEKKGEIEKRKLEPAHIREMFRLNSKYLQDVATVFNVLASKSVLSDLIRKYLRYERISKYAYMNSTAIDKSSQSGQAVTENINGNFSREMQDVENKRKLSPKQYRRVLKNREEFRNKILGAIKMEIPENDIAEHEILDISKWVYRRWEQGINNSAIIEVGSILNNLSQKMAQRAEKINNQ